MGIDFEKDMESLADELEFSEASLSDKKRTELIELCKELELATYGSKAQLVSRLVEFAESSLGSNVVKAESSIIATPLTEEEKEVGRAVRI